MEAADNYDIVQSCDCKKMLLLDGVIQTLATSWGSRVKKRLSFIFFYSVKYIELNIADYF